ncbi:MAG: S-methyl-5'-thioinosine phosphorylase [Porticoccaceae bacterium]
MSSPIAIIGGSGLQTLPDFRLLERIEVTTTWGSPSASVQYGTLDETELLFLPRHGGERAIPPHKVNYRANIATLAELGARYVFAFNATGGIGADFPAGTLVIPDQIIDYTWGREHSFWEDDTGDLLHVDFTRPYDDGAREYLLRGARAAGVSVVPHGVYAATQGPRLESAAEIRRLRQDGCDLVGMTGMPEAVLAREKKLAYASLALVVNAAAGISAAALTMADIRAVMAREMPRAVDTLAAAAACAFSELATS